MRIRGEAIRLGIFAAVTLVTAVLLYLTLGRITLGPTDTYKALMGDVSGLEKGDLVRIAGVRVGQVDGLEVERGNDVLVTFHVEEGQQLTSGTQVMVRYENLLGDRYVELAPGGPADSKRAPLSAGATIPKDQTTPALDLDVLLNGFRPLFRGLQPDQVNELAGNLISTLQGRGGTVESLLSRTASLTNGLADNDKAIGSLIDNLDVVLGSLDSRDTQLRSTITQMQRLVSGLAKDRDPIGRSVSSINALTRSLNALFAEVRAPLADTIAGVQAAASVLARNSDKLDEILELLPGTYARLSRVASHGSFFNFYLCSVEVIVSGLDGKPVHTPIVSSNKTTKRCL